MDIKDLTIGQVEQIQSMFSKQKLEDTEHPFEIGKNYLIRTVTMIITGKLIYVGPKELKMESAAWIADTGRFSDALKDAQKFSEVEPFEDYAIIGRGAIVDATPIKDIITVQK